jgi:hypothetical protein
MSQIDKPEIEELLSCYLDGELSERQCNEVKRLLKHDDEVARMYNGMQKQKQLLNSFPVDAAPETLLDDVKASLERNMLLRQAGQTIQEVVSSRNLMLRRILTVAAMLLLPVGLLTLVVFTIITPPGPDRGAVTSGIEGPEGAQPGTIIETLTSDNTSGILVFDNTHFNAALQFRTAEFDAVNSFIEKAVYRNGLADSTISALQDGTKNYRTTSTPKLMEALLRDMEKVWPKCSSSRLTVYDIQARPAAVVENISAEQVLTIFEQSAPAVRIALAKNFASSTSTFDSLEGDVGFDPSAPIKPLLTGPEEQAIEDQTLDDERITLIITVDGL